MTQRRGFIWLVVLSIGVLAGVRAVAAQNGAEPAEASGDVYARLVDEYMQGKWDDLEKDLLPRNSKQLSALSTAQKKDVKYLRDTLAECRPPWWRQAKEGQEFNFRPSVWGRTMRASFDPEQKTNVNINYTDGRPSLTLKWETGDLDSPDQAEHGFTKGELADLGVWSCIGNAEALALTPMQSELNLSDADKLKLTRYIYFNGNLAGVYYGTPRARRWALWLYCAAYLEKYAADPTVNTRKAVGAMFLAEVAAHRAKYPSIHLPDLPGEKFEENLCIELKNRIEKNPWTLPEDKLLREAVRAFALLNERDLLHSGVVTLPNGLPLALDPKADQPDQEARDQWLKRTLERPAG